MTLNEPMALTGNALSLWILTPGIESWKPGIYDDTEKGHPYSDGDWYRPWNVVFDNELNGNFEYWDDKNKKWESAKPAPNTTNFPPKYPDKFDDHRGKYMPPSLDDWTPKD